MKQYINDVHRLVLESRQQPLFKDVSMCLCSTVCVHACMIRLQFERDIIQKYNNATTCVLYFVLGAYERLSHCTALLIVMSY